MVHATSSVWDYMESNIARYINPSYEAASMVLGDPVLLQVCPAIYALELWREFFMRVSL